MAKKRIVGIACFYEQDLKTRDPNIVYGLYENDEEEAMRLKNEEELKISGGDKNQKINSNQPKKNTILIGIILLHVH